MAKSFIWTEETKECINEVYIGYMINTILNIKKAFREQVDKCTNNTLGEIPQHQIIITLSKKNTRVLELLLFYETRQNPKKYSRVLSCVIYTIIRNYDCIDYLACESICLGKLPVNTEGGFKHEKIQL